MKLNDKGAKQEIIMAAVDAYAAYGSMRENDTLSARAEYEKRMFGLNLLCKVFDLNAYAICADIERDAKEQVLAMDAMPVEDFAAKYQRAVGY